jgi:hypothetical protein
LRQECQELVVRSLLSIGVAACALLAAVGLYADRYAAPGCNSEAALHRVYEILRDQFHLDSIFLNGVTTESGELFSNHRDCSGEVAQIRGGVSMTDMPWREIRYRIVLQDTSQPPVVTVELRGPVPMAPPEPSFWERFLNYL